MVPTSRINEYPWREYYAGDMSFYGVLGDDLIPMDALLDLNAGFKADIMDIVGEHVLFDTLFQDSWDVEWPRMVLPIPATRGYAFPPATP